MARVGIRFQIGLSNQRIRTELIRHLAKANASADRRRRRRRGDVGRRREEGRFNDKEKETR